MAENKFFQRTVKKETVEAISSIVSKEHKDNFTHYSHKFDGTHVELIFSRDSIQFITRDGNDVSHLVPYLVEELKASSLLEAYYGVYACELVHIERVRENPKDAWSASRRVLGCKEYNPDEPKIQCVVYDIHSREVYPNRNLYDYPYAVRRNIYMLQKAYPSVIDEMVTPLRHLDSFFTPSLNVIDDSFESAWEYHINVKKREGFVLVNCEQEHKKPIPWNHTFTKLKPFMDIDCVVMGYNEGALGTKLEGKLGSFDVGLYRDNKLVSIGKVPTMSDEERVKWTTRMSEPKWCYDKGYCPQPYHPSTELCKKCTLPYVIQVKASEVTSGNKLRFPSYVRERTDKTPKECLWSQIE